MGLKVLQEVGDEWAKENANIVLEPPVAQGIIGLNASDVGVRLAPVKSPRMVEAPSRRFPLRHAAGSARGRARLYHVAARGTLTGAVRLMVKVKPGEQWAAERALRTRLKEAFDAQGVEIPFPRQVVYHRHEEGSPPPEATTIP